MLGHIDMTNTDIGTYTDIKTHRHEYIQSLGHKQILEHPGIRVQRSCDL